MSWKDWSNRQKLRLQLSELGQLLNSLKSAFEQVSDLSSRMVASRVHRALANYWKAVDAYEREDFEKARKLIAVGIVEAGFIAKLLEAETTERELGESAFFEYADKSDSKSSLERIDQSLELVGIELDLFLTECKKRKAL